MVQTLLNQLQLINETAVPPTNKPDDPRGNPRLWNYTWTNFGDYVEPKNNNPRGSPNLFKNCL